MTPERARELLGGLAAGILTPEERQTLMEAALHDQALFNEVAGELELAAFLQSPETRAQLANRIEVEPERRRWWALRPAWLALSGVLAASVVLYVAISHRPAGVAQLSVAVNKEAALPPPPVAPDLATEQAKKPVHGPKFTSIARSLAAAKPRPAVREPAVQGGAKAGAKAEAVQTAPPPEQRPEPGDKETQTAPPGASAMRAAPMAPRAASPPPAPPRPAEHAVMARAFLARPATASLSGTVRDAAGAAIPGARVEIVDNAASTTLHKVADANGYFEALSLPTGGPYTVIANAPGFMTERRSVTLESNQNAQIDIPLRPGEMAQSISVTGAASMLPASQQSLTQVAVLDFANGNRQNPSGAQVADQLSNQLLTGGQVGVIDREKVQQAAQSQNVTGRPPNAQEAADLGRRVGADAVILGSVQAPGPAGVAGFGKDLRKAKVMAEIIDTKKATPLATVSADAASLRGATDILGNKIQSQLVRTVEGKVTHRSGDIVSVTFAEASGLQIGARCDVIRGTRKLGELVITSVNGLSAFGKFSGTSQPRAGDRVTSSR